MKLLYLYIEEYGCIKDQEFNFDSEMQFHYDSKKTPPLSIVGQDLLPKNFWGDGNVKSVSAIVGNNGAGKTTIARFIADFIYDTEKLNKTHFIIIFKTEIESTECIYNLKNTKLEIINKERKITCKSFEEYKDDARNDGEDSPIIEPANVLYNIGFIYHSNHYSISHKWNNIYLDNINSDFDLSTTAFLYRDNDITLHDRINGIYDISLDGHKIREYKRILSLMQKVFSNKIKISEQIQKIIPKKIIIRDIVNDFFQHNKEKINKKLTKLISDEDQKNKILNKLEIFCETFHHKNETFIDFRIKTYVRFIFIEACLSDLIEFEKILDCLQETNDSNDQEQTIKRIINFLRKDTYPKHKIPYLAQKIFNLQKSKNKYNNQDIKANKDGCIIINRKQQFNELLQVFKNESDSFNFNDCFSFQFDPVLSSGQMSLLTIFSRLYEFLSHLKTYPLKYTKEFIIFYDEIEITLEPNLQRQIVSYMIDFLNSFKNYSFHIIFASHSPILLSDIPDTNVVFLKKVSGHTQVVDHETTKTFGSNIYTLYKKSFFMDEGLMGAFAEQKIEDIIKDLLALELKAYSGGRKKRYKELDQEIELIGEPVIRNQLKDRLNWVQMREKWDKN